jgi:tripartite-type tricarboxylate transporter receptor subunit TctC
MRNTLDQIKQLLLGLVLAMGVAAPAMAQASWPSKPIRLIAPFAAGGSTDVLARIIAPEMSKRLGQPIVVENRAGAGGNIGMDAIAKAEPDGYTIGMASPGPLVVNVTLLDSLPYNPLTDFAPIALIADLPIVLVVHNSVAANDVKSLIAADKANPGKLFFASAGNGTTMHLSGELFNVMAGTKLQHVAYKGTGPAVTDLLGGLVQIGFLDLPAVGPHLESGKIKILAVGNRKRAARAPNVPTIAEAGVPGYETSGWFGVLAPARVPPAIIKRLNAVLVEVMALPEVRSRLLAVGIEPTSTTPEQFDKFIRSEIPKWAKVIEASGAKAKR